MLVELGLVEQRYAVVPEVLGGGVTDVALRDGVARQTVHEWSQTYATEGMPGLVDRSSNPERLAIGFAIDLSMSSERSSAASSASHIGSELDGYSGKATR